MICTTSALDIFEEPPLQASVEKSHYVNCQPLSSLESGPLEFYAPATSDYVDLSRTQLYLKIKVVKGTGESLEANQDVSIANNVLSTLFQKVEVYFNDQLITDAGTHYAYKAFIETILNYSEEAKKTQLRTQLFISDSDAEPSVAKARVESGYNKRKASIAGSRTVELCGPLHLDICHSDRYILNDVNIKFVFTRSKNEFVLMSDEAAASYKVIIENASLFIRKVKVSPAVILAHAKVLQEGANAIYPINSTTIKHFIIPSGLTDVTRENLWLNRIPNRVLLCMTAASGYNGDYKKNPFKSHHYNLNYLSFNVNGQNYPSKSFSPDFSNRHFTREYLSVFQALGYYGRNKGFALTYESFRSGHAFFAIDLTADENASSSCAEIPRSGNLSVELKFARALEEPVACLLLAEFEAKITINKNRFVQFIQ